MKRILYILMFALLAGCTNTADQHTEPEHPSFTLLRKDRTGLDFTNQLQQRSDFNVFNYMYFFNGGGLAAGDFNNDGLVDLYFTNNMGPNKLFLNEGELRFRDVTETAKVAGLPGWTSGATVVDINNDGLLDIYVSQIGEHKSIRGRSQLYVCQDVVDGVPIFEDEAVPYGLDLVGYGTQAAFLDYDQDGDLDMFQLNHSLHANGTFGRKNTFAGTQHPLAGDKLLRNDNGTFTEVTLEAGLNSTVIGYGLGVAVSDINLDGWPDIYVANDFHENDYLYINQQDGTFSEEAESRMRHTSRFSMGVEVADINNDAQPDVITLDMLPEDPFILKSSLAEDEYSTFHFKLSHGYQAQFARNNLQLNSGNGVFSEVGMYARVDATDWSWAPLFFDFDNDGYRDLFISNGIPRRMNDIDYINFRESHDLRWIGESDDLEESELVYVDSMPQIKLPNKFFRNGGALRFTDLEAEIGQAAPSYSTGAVYADFDNDGDLDVVVNNHEDEPFLYQNMAAEQQRLGDYLHLALEGPASNRNAIGALVVAYKGEETLLAQHHLSRGYQSAQAPGIYLGVGAQASVDSVLVIWPDGSYESLTPVYNQQQMVSWQAGLPRFDYVRLCKRTAEKLAFAKMVLPGLTAGHQENSFVDFHREALMPNMVSAEGPALAVGDVNGDGREDVFVGGAKDQSSALYFQQAKGTFEAAPADWFAATIKHEHIDAAFGDLNGDGHLDLVVANGGNEFRGPSPQRVQSIYLNDGMGKLVWKPRALSDSHLTAASVDLVDFDQDGDLDIFFAGRTEPWHYGQAPGGLLYRNDGNLSFNEISASAAPDLATLGMMTDSHWADLDQDGDPDLLLTLEWGNVSWLRNDDGQFTAQPLTDLPSWWNTAIAHDIDGDGDLDVLAGSYGENAKLRPTPEQPVRMYMNDYDSNDQQDHILTCYMEGQEYPYATFMELTKQLTPLKKKYLYSRDFARASLAELFGADQLAQATQFEITTLSHTWFEQTAPGQFTPHRLPDELQFSTINALTLQDLDGDGQEEVLVGGNFMECNIEMGGYDASYGHYLRWTNGMWEVHSLGEVNMLGKVKHIVPLQVGKTPVLLYGRNDAEVSGITYDR